MRLHTLQDVINEEINFYFTDRNTPKEAYMLVILNRGLSGNIDENH